ncbi:MAG: DUF3011 domain-containing protein [Pseudoxanthomonas sp.]
MLALCGCATVSGGWWGGDGDQAQSVQVQHFECASVGHDLHYCDVDTSAGVRLVEQKSRTPCIKDHTWGYDEHGVWVNGGCRGQFVTGAGNDDDPWDAEHGVVRCESKGQERRRCNTPVTLQPPQLLHQLSDTDCSEGGRWGWDAQGIWVDGGCRALFRVR